MGVQKTHVRGWGGVGWDNGQTVPCNVCLHCASSLYNDVGLCHPMNKQMKVKGKGNEI